MSVHTSQTVHADLLAIASRVPNLRDAALLRVIALDYRRMERALDELADDAREDERIAERVVERAARAEATGRVRADAAAELQNVLTRWRRA